MDKNTTLDRLDRLAARLEQDGQYVEANVCVNAYIELCGREPPTWRKIVDELWDDTSSERFGISGLDKK